jgi:hypothetical protein
VWFGVTVHEQWATAPLRKHDLPSELGKRYSTLIPAALSIGHHFSISALW